MDEEVGSVVFLTIREDTERELVAFILRGTHHDQLMLLARDVAHLHAEMRVETRIPPVLGRISVGRRVNRGDQSHLRGTIDAHQFDPLSHSVTDRLG